MELKPCMAMVVGVVLASKVEVSAKGLTALIAKRLVCLITRMRVAPWVKPRNPSTSAGDAKQRV